MSRRTKTANARVTIERREFVFPSRPSAPKPSHPRCWWMSAIWGEADANGAVRQSQVLTQSRQ
jgi:hypothetical protein